MSKDIEFNPAFERAMALLEDSAQTLFVTGKAGTGKSTLLHYFCQTTKKKPIVLAPTGVAALNVKGQTIHSFFNFYIDVTPEKILNKDIKPKNKKLYKKIKMIIIDEVSMLRADILDCIDVFLRMYGPHDDLPFGGIKMVFVGDLYQLPPVVTYEEKAIFESHYSTPYFFSAQALKDHPIEIIELEKVYRQKQTDFLNLLNKIRNNSVEPHDLVFLNSRFETEPEIEEKALSIHLTTTNKKADAINHDQLEALKGDGHVRRATISGKFTKEYFPTATDLHFKIGSQVMLLNNDPKKRWVNGSIGVIKKIKTDKEGEEYLSIRLQESDHDISVYPYTWEIYRFVLKDDKILSEPIGTFTQYPFRLAWAVTIHKSQGKTFDRVILDLDKGTFASGQLYVALSRCTSFEGLSLKTPILPKHVRIDPRIFKFITQYHYQQALESLPIETRIQIIQKAIATNTPIEITYLKPNDTKSQRVIQPITVGLESYRGKRFPGMKAFCLERQEERLFHIGRILSIETLNDASEGE